MLVEYNCLFLHLHFLKKVFSNKYVITKKTHTQARTKQSHGITGTHNKKRNSCRSMEKETTQDEAKGVDEVRLPCQ